jgi:beta-lactamase class A
MARGLGAVSWLVWGLLVLLLGAALWKVGALGWDAARHWAFTRPHLADGQANPPPTPRPELELQAAVDAAAARGSGTVGAYVWDLSNGASAELEPDRPFPAASLVKLPVLVEVLRQERVGRLDANEQLEIKQRHWADGAGVLQAQVGRSYSVARLTELMIGESDNIAARVLMDRVGVDNINETVTALGLTQTRVQPLADDGGERAPHVTSARDMGTLLGVIASGGLVDASTSEQALRHLEGKQANAWLADGLPWWAKLAHKWGDLPQARHDAGIVYTPRGRYVVVVLTEGKRPDDAADTIARVSRAAFDRLGAEGE